MSWLDALLVALLGVALYSGYRRGAVLQVIGVAGLAVGVFVGVMLAPRVAEMGDSPPASVALVLGTVLVAGAIGNTLGWAVGTRLRRRTRQSPLGRIDAVGGSALSAVTLVLATWFLVLNLAEGPFPALSRGLRDSRIVRTLDSALPAPPSLVGEAERLLSQLGLPDTLVGPGEPAEPVEPPTDAEAEAATLAAKDSTVEVLGTGCDQGYVNQGSGFVADHDLVVTNAHVVAGTHEQWVEFAGEARAAMVVVFDPALDVAVLRVHGLGLEPLPLLSGEAERGDVGAILGYPGGGSLEADDAAIRAVIDPVGRDIYGTVRVRRRIYEVQATIRRGSSGGPFVLSSGEVAGLVFASSVRQEGVGYAIASEELLPMVVRAGSLTVAVDTRTCAG